jgi:orotate phosphoribosyltransferase-like protein
MGQQKGNPTPSYQNQAYEALRPNTNARENRDYGTKPVMIDDNTTLNEVVDITFETDAVAAMVSASLNTTIYAVSASIGNNITAVSGSINTTIGAVSSSTNTRIESVISTGTQLASIMAYTASLLSVKLHSGSLINFANDAAAETGGVPVGNLYHTAGAVKVRLT